MITVLWSLEYKNKLPIVYTPELISNKNVINYTSKSESRFFDNFEYSTFT